VIISLIAIGLAMIWTLLPIFGWNEYTMEVIKMKKNTIII